ncbi:MAG: hypothetical protein ACC663_09335 [Gammaproteobacteria bacterium]
MRLSDLLSRYLEPAKIIESFTDEIRADISYTGYRFEAPDGETVLSQGEIEGFEVSYRLSIQDRQLGNISLYRSYGFSDSELGDLEDFLCALVQPLKNAMMYQTALKTAYRYQWRTGCR